MRQTDTPPFPPAAADHAPYDQGAALDFLATPAAHGLPPDTAVERIDTHISAVFLAGSQALKIKKAVTLPFLDFVPLAAREQACRAEIDLNRRTAPSLYLGLAALCRTPDGNLSIQDHPPPDTAVVDWVIRMARFPQTALLDQIAAAQGLDRTLLLDLAEGLAAFHKAAAPTRSYGGAAAMHHTLDGIATSMEAHRGAVFKGREIDHVLSATRSRIHALTARLDQRRSDGLVRQCHGDLHLRNICLLDGKPVAFDCIEFNQDFAQIDILYDLAFLLMDLRHAGYAREASTVLNAWLEQTNDLGGLVLLPLFLSLRAQIRAHVVASMAAYHQDPAPLHSEARRYLREAERYLLPSSPQVVAVGGLSGSGKSRCARRLADGLGQAAGAVVLRTDVIRKRLFGRGPYEALPPEAYTPDASAQTYAALYADALAVLGSGLPVIADAVFARPEERDAIAAVAAAAGVPFRGLWLEAAMDVAADRIRKRTRNASDATVAVLQQQQTYDTGPIHWARINSSGSRRDTDRQARAALRQPA